MLMLIRSHMCPDAYYNVEYDDQAELDISDTLDEWFFAYDTEGYTETDTVEAEFYILGCTEEEAREMRDLDEEDCVLEEGRVLYRMTWQQEVNAKDIN